MRQFYILVCCLSSLLGTSQQGDHLQYDLMPWPTQVLNGQGTFDIDNSFTIGLNDLKSERVQNAAVKFLRRLSSRTGVFLNEGFPTTTKGNLQINYEQIAELNIDVDESYSLKVEDGGIEITSKTDIGAVRALETLLQLVDFNSTGYYFPAVSITDQPRFRWRGLMIDVARHFQPISVIKRNLDAMASVKMNVFHWHLSDDQGFRVQSNSFPKLHQVASDGQYYDQHQIKEIIDYADLLGIRVVPEFDVPGHASAILTAYPELSSKSDYHYSVERFSGVFDPTLNPTLDTTYDFLEQLFTEMTSLFPDEYFHIGGDENAGKHWDENEKIQSFMKKHHLKSNHDLQTHFNIKLQSILDNLGKKLMGWDEIMTPNMPTSAIIHSWRGENEGFEKRETLISAAKNGYFTVLSDGYYIDRMQPVEEHYSVDPLGNASLTENERSRVLGGEATMWSELVTPLTIDSRIWPRTAAIAERFWSQQDVTDIEHMKKRLKVVSFHLEELGLTHIKNRDVILRSMTNNQEINSLVTLTKVCEPLKIYQRNKDGIEYKTYSPFNLFADACTADADNAWLFNRAVDDLKENPTDSNKEQVASFLNEWSNNYRQFSKLQMNPKLISLEPLSENLSIVSTGLLNLMKDSPGQAKSPKVIESAIDSLSVPVQDVELVIVDSLNELFSMYSTKNSKGKY